MAPVFTLRLDVVSVIEFRQTKTATRWVIESDDPAWIRLKSGEGSINSAAHSEWAHRWATDQVAEHSPYTVTRWLEDEAGSTWTAELKRIRHDFRLTWENVPPMVLTAKNQEDADEIERRVLEGESFVRLHNEAGDTVLIGLSQILSITYQPVEVDL